MTTLTAPARLEDDIDFAVTSAKLVPIVLLLDDSSSMGEVAADAEGARVPKSEGLRRGLAAAVEYVRNDAMLRKAARLNLVSFSGAVASTGFHAIDALPLPSFGKGGGTAMRAALTQAASQIEAFLYEQNAAGVSVSTTTLLMISDGMGNDGPCDAAMRRLLELQEQKLVHLIGGGINADDARRLTAMGFPEVYTLDRMTWKDLIQLATVSAKRLAQGQHGAADPMTGGA